MLLELRLKVSTSYMDRYHGGQVIHHRGIAAEGCRQPGARLFPLEMRR